MLFASLLSVLCALSTASPLPVSLLPVRPYVFLAPELPKFQIQPTVKVQPSSPIQPSLAPQPAPKPDATGTRQYVLVYPYQFIATRQDEASGTGFFEAIQNYFINFGNGQQQSDEPAQPLDAVEIDKPQTAATAAPATDAAKPPAAPAKIDSKQKFVYSYATPASTVPLSADRRVFFLAEQPQLFGTFSGPSVNPVFNLQPVPVLASRSNIAQAPDEPQPNKIVSENVQKFSQIPPVMATVEQKSTEPQVKSVVIQEQTDLVQADLAENRVAPVLADNRAIAVPEEIVKVPELKTVPLVPELPALELVPEVKAAEAPVVLARSNAVPITVTAAEIPIEKPADPVPVVPANEALVESGDQSASVLVPELKDISQTVKVLEEPALAPLVDQSVPSSEPVAIAEII